MLGKSATFSGFTLTCDARDNPLAWTATGAANTPLPAKAQSALRKDSFLLIGSAWEATMRGLYTAGETVKGEREVNQTRTISRGKGSNPTPGKQKFEVFPKKRWEGPGEVKTCSFPDRVPTVGSCRAWVPPWRLPHTLVEGSTNRRRRAAYALPLASNCLRTKRRVVVPCPEPLGLARGRRANAGLLGLRSRSPENFLSLQHHHRFQQHRA